MNRVVAASPERAAEEPSRSPWAVSGRPPDGLARRLVGTGAPAEGHVDLAIVWQPADLEGLDGIPLAQEERYIGAAGRPRPGDCRRPMLPSGLVQPFGVAVRLPVVSDDPQFREFFAGEYGRLRRLGFLLTGDWTLAEELAQDALVRVYWVWPRVRRLRHPGAYARRVLVNRHRSLLRRAVIEARHAVRTYTREAYLPDLGEDAMVLWGAIRDLPPRQRAVLVLRFYEGLTEAEVARLLRLPLGTVKSLAHRGLARLRATLGAAATGNPRGGMS